MADARDHPRLDVLGTRTRSAGLGWTWGTSVAPSVRLVRGVTGLWDRVGAESSNIERLGSWVVVAQKPSVMFDRHVTGACELQSLPKCGLTT